MVFKMLQGGKGPISIHSHRWMSEKMDGVRAYWNGEKLLSRSSKDIVCPEWFTAALPSDIALDGELWSGQGTTHENILQVMNSKDGDWSQIGYYVFDIPSSSGTYEERMQEMENVNQRLPPHVHIVSNVQCKGAEDLRDYLDFISATRGEGVMLRKPQTKNEAGLTSSILKVKVKITSICYSFN